MLRITVAVPSGDHVHASFAMALANLCHLSSGYALQLTSVRSSIIAVARNNAVEEALKFRSEYLLFLDSDMAFPPTTLNRLLAHGQDVVGATYVKRVPPFRVIGRALDQQPSPQPSGLIEMERIPAGCSLIRMSVFDKLARPFFRFGINTNQEIVGEDFLFCEDARAAGFRIWCDAALTQEMVHFGERGCRLSDAPEMDLNDYDTKDRESASND